MGSIKPKMSKAGITLRLTVQKLRKDIERVVSEGKRIDPYSLGFTNALIFAEHRVNNLPGKPKLYNQELEIGTGIPKPRPLVSDEEQAISERLDILYDDLFEAANLFLGDRSEPTLYGLELKLYLAVQAIKSFLDSLEKPSPEPAEAEEFEGVPV